MAVNVTWMQDAGYTAAQDRTEQLAIVAKSAVVSARGGIVPSDGTDAVTTQLGTPGMAVDVNPFQAIIPDANGRAYLLTSDSIQAPTFAASSGANPRIDLVIARVYDNAAGDTAATGSLTLPGAGGTITVQTVTGTVEVVTGTPASVPAAPALPNTRCIILAIVTVRKSTTSILNSDIALSGGGDVAAPFTCSAGGVLVCRNSSEYPSTPYEGFVLYDQSLNLVLVWTGAAWGHIAYDSGWTTASLAGAWTSTGVTPNGAVQFRLFNGMVVCTGAAKSGTGTAFTFPPGYRPLNQLNRIVSSAGGAAIITITSAGVVAVSNFISPGSNAGVNFDFQFFAEQ